MIGQVGHTRITATVRKIKNSPPAGGSRPKASRAGAVPSSDGARCAGGVRWVTPGWPCVVHCDQTAVIEPAPTALFVLNVGYRGLIKGC